MSQEPSSSAPLATLENVDQSFSSEQPLPSDSAAAAPDQTLATFLRVSQWVSVGLLALVCVAVPINLLMNAAKERDRRKCGADWMLWLVGSNETAQEMVDRKLEKSRKEFDEQFKDLYKPLEFTEFNLDKALNLYKPEDRADEEPNGISSFP